MGIAGKYLSISAEFSIFFWLNYDWELSIFVPRSSNFTENKNHHIFTFYEPKHNQIMLFSGWSSKFIREIVATTSHNRPKQFLLFIWVNFIIISGLFFTQISEISRDFSYWNENFVKTKFVVTWVSWWRITKYDRSPCVPTRFLTQRFQPSAQSLTWLLDSSTN